MSDKELSEGELNEAAGGRKTERGQLGHQGGSGGGSEEEGPKPKKGRVRWTPPPEFQ